MDVKDHLPLSELKRLERIEKEADRAKRFRIVILGQEGWTAPAVAMAVGLSRRICQRWVRRFNDEGLAGLDDRRGRASKLPLTPEQQDQMRRRLDAGPIAADEVCSLRGKDVQRIGSHRLQLPTPHRTLRRTSSPTSAAFKPSQPAQPANDVGPS